MSLLGTWLAKFTGAMGGAPAAGAIVVGGLIVGIVVGAGTGGGAIGGSPAPSVALSEIYPCPNMGPPLLTVKSGQHVYVTGKTADGTWLRIHYGSAGRAGGVDPGERLPGPRVPRRRPGRELCARGAPGGRPVADRVDDGDGHLRADPGPDDDADGPADADARRRAPTPTPDTSTHAPPDAARRRHRPTPKPTPKPPPDTTQPTVGTPTCEPRSAVASQVPA